MLRARILRPRTPPEPSRRGWVSLSALGAQVFLLLTLFYEALGEMTLAGVVALEGLMSAVAVLCGWVWQDAAERRTRENTEAWIRNNGLHWEAGRHRLEVQSAIAKAMRGGRLDEAFAVYEEYMRMRGGLEKAPDCEGLVKFMAQAHVLGREKCVREYERLVSYYLSRQPPEMRKASAICRVILKYDPKNPRARERLRSIEAQARGMQMPRSNRLD